MAPGEVVYADRLQATGLTVNLFCTVTDTAGIPLPCTVTGDVTLELFQQTKNANSFAFFLRPLAPNSGHLSGPGGWRPTSAAPLPGMPGCA